MRRVVLVLVSACVVLAAACSAAKNPIAPTVSLGSPFDLKVGSSAIVASDFSIRFDEVPSDSRCPMDAICVWAGEAIVAVTLSESPRTGTRRELRTTPSASEVVHASYAIKLVQLQPYPQSRITIDKKDYVATLVVTKK